MDTAHQFSRSAMFKMLLMLILWMHLILASEDTEAAARMPASVSTRATRTSYDSTM